MGRCFAFPNCSLLVQTDLFRDIVETHSHSPPQGNYSRPFYTSFPGSEIPAWFRRQCRGSSVTARLPPNWFDKKFLGFAICAVTNKPQAVDYYELSARCLCIFKGNHCEHRFSFYLFHSNFNSRNWLESNHMLLGYVPWSEFGINGEKVNERCYTAAKFEIQLLHCEGHHMLPSTVRFDPSIERCDPCIEKCGVQFFFANNEEVALQDFVEPMVHSERCSAEPSGSDMTSDNSHEEQYLKLLSKLFDGPKRNSEDIYAYISDESDCKIEDHEVQVDNSERSLEGCAAEPSGSALTTDTSDKDEQYLKLSELVDKPNINFRDIHGYISDESDCEIEDNDPSGKRKIVSWWRQKVRVTSGLKQGLLDDGFSWNWYSRGCIPEKGTGYQRSIYKCTHQSSCRAIGKLRTCVNNPTICKIKYIGKHTCWKTLSMLTHQVRVTPDMGLEAEGPFDGFSWGEYGQMNLPGAKHPRVCYVCSPQNVQGCMAIKEVQRSNDDPTILKITYRGRHTCIQAYTISIGGRGDGRISEGGCALRIHDQVVQSPRSLGENGSGGNVIRLADRAMDDNNVIMIPDANSQDMEHSQDVNRMENKNMAGYPNHGGVVSEGTSDAVVNQSEEDPMDFNSLKKRKREMNSDDDQPTESNSISNNNP